MLIFEVYIISAYIDLMVYVGTLLWFKFAKITSPIVGNKDYYCLIVKVRVTTQKCGSHSIKYIGVYGW